MDRATVAVYEDRGEHWARNRTPVHADAARRFGAAVRPAGVRFDAGAGGGRYTTELGEPVVAMDAARTMLGILGTSAPAAMRVQGDLEALPFRRAAFAGTWANMSYVHVPRARWPLALADLHRALEVGAPVEIATRHGDFEGIDPDGDDLGGRFFTGVDDVAMRDLGTGAGFEVDDVVVDDAHGSVRLRGRRALSLADTVGPGMRLLVCGLNPSVYSAERGVGYARPGNRFWKAAIAARIVTRPLDALHALREHGVGITDLCKRATRAASELSRDEYRDGLARVERLARWLEPGAVVFVGLDGVRKAISRDITVGSLPGGVGGRPAYVMPSTSGLNARTPVDELVAHLRAATHL